MRNLRLIKFPAFAAVWVLFFSIIFLLPFWNSLISNFTATGKRKTSSRTMIENVPFASTTSHAKQKPEYFSTAQKDLVLMNWIPNLYDCSQTYVSGLQTHNVYFYQLRPSEDNIMQIESQSPTETSETLGPLVL